MRFAENWQPPNRGALFVVTGPSGTGKTTLIRETMNLLPELKFSISATTRTARHNEKDGMDYRFIGADDFEKAVQAGEFLEHAEVYGNRYGTLRAPIEKALAQGNSIVLDIDYQGAEQVLAQFPSATSIYVLPPSLDILESRLRARRTDSDTIIQKRMGVIHNQLQHCIRFEFLVVNDDLESAIIQFSAIFIATLMKCEHRSDWVNRFIQKS